MLQPLPFDTAAMEIDLFTEPPPSQLWRSAPVPEQPLILGRYRITKLLGEGVYGQVWLGQDAKGEGSVALKLFKRQEGSQDGVHYTALRELAALKLLNHPNVVRLLDVGFHEDGTHLDGLVLVMEAAQRHLGTVIDRRQGVSSPAKRLSYARDLLAGVDYCHKRGVMHRDLKPENLLHFDRGDTLKLADFGLQRCGMIDAKRLTKEVISLWYRAPEILMGSPLYTTTADVWSAGCIIAELARGRPLFETPNAIEFELLIKIFRTLGTPPVGHIMRGLPYWQDRLPNFTRFSLTAAMRPVNGTHPLAPPELVELVRSMLKLNHLERISAADALRMPYFEAPPAVDFRTGLPFETPMAAAAASVAPKRRRRCGGAGGDTTQKPVRF
eukprot:TRINITY_DN3802_c1_g3_i6.p2 TRINITY_DN3802_c1_g3~~TRINITY_DN3802_c1_g3_i6.p2  ORF type:complete len:418 (+),score=146.07 TRINITY_DN3802_c1_g3_i6:104-1255(+)